MKTELVFKLEKEPKGYGQRFVPGCKVTVKNTKGIMYLDYSNRHPVGTFENLRCDGEQVLADVELFEKFRNLEHRFEYAISGSVKEKNNDGECNEVQIEAVAVLMPAKD